MAKVKITILTDMDLNPINYSTVYDKDGGLVDLTEDQRKELTPKQMLEHDKSNLLNGDFGMEEYISYGDFDIDKGVTIELVEE